MALDLVALRAAGVGDLLTSVPALRALADEGASLTLAAPAWLHPLARLVPGVTNIVDVAGLRPRCALSGAVAVNLHGRGPQSHSALLAGHPRDLVAFRCPRLWDFGPEWFIDSHEPERERFCRLLSWVGIEADPRRIGLERPPGEDPVSAGTVVLHVGGTDPDRRWPPEAFAALAGRLHGHRIVITGGPGDLVTAQRTAELAGLDPDQVLAGRLALDEFAGVVAQAGLLVTGDTGAAHLAYAYDTPVAVIFGPASPGQWGPPPHARSQLLRAPGEAPRAAEVAVDDVEQAVNRLLEAS